MWEDFGKKIMIDLTPAEWNLESQAKQKKKKKPKLIEEPEKCYTEKCYTDLMDIPKTT